ncbi:MAG: hypothetical protein ABI306_07215 [Caulobacteraceae bacterium]
MVQMRYTGFSTPKAVFDELRPFRHRLLDMQRCHRPFGSDYLIVSAVVQALDTAAYHFTGDSDFFSIKPQQSDSGAPPSTVST